MVECVDGWIVSVVIVSGLAKGEMNGREGVVSEVDEDRLIVNIPRTAEELKSDSKKKRKKSKKVCSAPSLTVHTSPLGLTHSHTTSRAPSSSSPLETCPHTHTHTQRERELAPSMSYNSSLTSSRSAHTLTTETTESTFHTYNHRSSLPMPESLTHSLTHS